VRFTLRAAVILVFGQLDCERHSSGCRSGRPARAGVVEVSGYADVDLDANSGPVVLVLAPEPSTSTPPVSNPQPPVGFLTVDVDSTVTRRFVVCSLGRVDREVTIPVSECISVILQRQFESCALEPPPTERATSATLKSTRTP
jgi:hypothetical protein